MCAMKYYEPTDKAKYKELRKNWKNEMKRPKPEFENHLKEYATNTPSQTVSNNQPMNYEYEETVTYEIVRQKKQAEFTPKGKTRMIWRNINKFLAIFLTGLAIYIWLPIIASWL